jgi:hypothetical protein
VPSLAEKYAPSPPCSCEVCRGYCRRPGWWTVEEAGRAINAGYGHRMMLELSPDRSFGVLSPAFGGCEAFFAVQEYASRGCSFYKDGLCELYGTGVQPLECRVCHHDHPGLGPACHADLEADWNTPAGRTLVAGWCTLTGVSAFLDAYGLSQLKA